MKKKISLFSITILLTIIIYSIAIYTQKKMIDYEPTVTCLVLTKQVGKITQINKENIKTVEYPVSLVSDYRLIQSYEEIQSLYTKGEIYAGQVLIKEQFDTKENLGVYKEEEGKEKIAIKIKDAENAVSYQIREGDRVNLYCTIRSSYLGSFLLEKEHISTGEELDGYSVIRVLEDTEILGIFDQNGIVIAKASESRTMNNIMIAVTKEEAKQINLLREIGTFHVTL